MKIVKPDFYDRFRCLAGACPDSCCHEWEVDVDDVAAAYASTYPMAMVLIVLAAKLVVMFF